MKRKLVAACAVFSVLLVGIGTANAASKASGSVTIVGPWRDAEATVFQKVLAGFTKKTGIKVTYSGVADPNILISTRLAAGSPPDMAIIPNAKGLPEFVKSKSVKPLDFMAKDLKSNFAASWNKLYTYSGKTYGFATRADIREMLWYNPTSVPNPPKTWAEFAALCDKTTKPSCTSGMAKDAWPLDALWTTVYLATNGAQKYADLYAGKIPFDDASVVKAMSRFTQFYGDKWAAGGTQGALGGGLMDGLGRVFGTTPDALFAGAGSWGGATVLDSVNKTLVPFKTIDYMLFPGDSANSSAVVATGDVAVVLKSNSNSQALAKYLASAEGEKIFTQNGYTVANKNVSTAGMTGFISKTAKVLSKATVASAVYSTEFQNKMIEVLGQIILDPTNAQTILKGFAPTAATLLKR